MNERLARLEAAVSQICAECASGLGYLGLPNRAGELRAIADRLRAPADVPTGFATTADLARELGDPDPEGTQRAVDAIVRRGEMAAVGTAPAVSEWDAAIAAAYKLADDASSGNGPLWIAEEGEPPRTAEDVLDRLGYAIRALQKDADDAS